jgi:hypothetical protein
MKNLFTIMIVFVATFSVYAQKPISPIKSSSTVLKRIGNDRFKVLDIFDNQDEVCIILDQYNHNKIIFLIKININIIMIIIKDNYKFNYYN